MTLAFWLLHLYGFFVSAHLQWHFQNCSLTTILPKVKYYFLLQDVMNQNEQSPCFLPQSDQISWYVYRRYFTRDALCTRNDFSLLLQCTMLTHFLVLSSAFPDSPSWTKIIGYIYIYIYSLIITYPFLSTYDTYKFICDCALA